MTCPRCTCEGCRAAPRSIPRRVLDLLGDGRERSATEIRAELDCNAAYLHNELSKLTAYELIVRVGRGRYRRVA